MNGNRKYLMSRLRVIDLSRQIEMPHPAYVEPFPRTPAEARDRLKEYLRQESRRTSNLKEVLFDNDIQLEDSRESLSTVLEFFHGCCLALPWVGDEPEDALIEFLWNLGQYTGNLLISRCPVKPKVNRWTVEKVSPPWDENRFEFSVSGYAGSSDSFCPNLFFLDFARAIRLEGISASEFSDYVVGRLNFILQLTENRCIAEMSRLGKHDALIGSRYL